jgi:hypothetical protein
MTRITIALLAALAFTAPVLSAEKPSTRWMAHCAANLKDAKLKASVVRIYCSCMAGLGDEAEMLTWSQTELERSYPPVHRQCRDKSRGRKVQPI